MYCVAIDNPIYWAYCGCTTANSVDWFDIQNVGAAKAAKRYACGFFYANALSLMGGRGRGRKAASAPTGMSTCYVPPTPLDIGIGGYSTDL